MNSAFATSDAAHSALTMLTRGQAIASSLLLAVLVIGLYTVGPLTLTVLLGGTSLACLAHGVAATRGVREAYGIGKRHEPARDETYERQQT
jgi:hypothetical protein